MMDYQATHVSRQRAPPRDLETSTLRPRDLEHVKPRIRTLRPNFFLKATLLTFDDFKERFGRVHAGLLENSGDVADGLAARVSNSACETNSQKGDHASIRSKSSTSISKSNVSMKHTTLAASQHSKENCLKDGDICIKESRKKQSKTKELLSARKADCNIPYMETSSVHENYSESNSHSESAFKTVDINLNARCSKHSKSLTCKLGGHKDRHKDCRVPPTLACIDATKGCLRKTDSGGSRTTTRAKSSKMSNFTKKCIEATQCHEIGYELCENGCNICNTSAVIDRFSGKLKRADSEHSLERKKTCQRICSETSVIRSRIKLQRSEINYTGNEPDDDEFVDKSSETFSIVSEREQCSESRLVQRSYAEDIADDTNRVLASKAKNYGFDYEDICDVAEPVNESSNSDEEDDDDDLKYLNKGRYSNEEIEKTKLMMIRRNYKKSSSGFFTLRGGVSIIMRPFKVIIRYLPLPPVNIIFQNKSPLDVLFRNEEVEHVFQNKNMLDEDDTTTDESDPQVSVTTSATSEKRVSQDSVRLDDRIWSPSSTSKTMMPPEETVSEGESESTSDITRTESLLPLSVSPSEKSCTLLTFEQENFFGRHNLNRSISHLTLPSHTSIPTRLTSEETVSEGETESTSDVTLTESRLPLSVSPSEESCTFTIRQLNLFGRHNLKRNISEPIFGSVPKQEHTLKKSVSDLMNVPSRFIPIRDYECIDSKCQMETKVVRILCLPLIIYAGCLLGYPTLMIYLLDMFFGPDFTSLIYLLMGVVIAYVYLRCKMVGRMRNDRKLDRIFR